MISNLLEANKKCPDIILIDENYCLNDSFDIIQKNFTFLLEKLRSSESSSEESQIIYDRYEDNKEKYQKFLTYVNQFSGNWLAAVQTFNTYKDFWRLKNAPLEVLYPVIIDISQWGTHDKGVIQEDTLKSQQTIEKVLKWANSVFLMKDFGIYENLNIRVYISATRSSSLEFKCYYDEECEAAGGSARICCEGCNSWSYLGYKGCNKSVVKGHQQCANMYEWCPGTSGKVTGFVGGTRKGNKGITNSESCVEGSCVGWASDSDKNSWRGRRLEIEQKILSPQTDYTETIGSVLIKIKKTDAWTENPNNKNKILISKWVKI